MKRIAVITANDNIWALSLWRRALPVLARAGYVVEGVWAVAPVTGKNTYENYIAAFGVWNFIKLGFFGMAVRLCQMLTCGPMSLRTLCDDRDIFYAEAATPNEDSVVDWMRLQQIDIVLLHVPHIVRMPLLKAVKGGIVNQHASLLPANRGIFPYFWAVVKGAPQGVSVHLVTEKVDGGAILYQEMVGEPEDLSSMCVFETSALRHYPARVCEALANLDKKMHQPPSGLDDSVHSFPAHADYKAFRAQRGHIIRLRDIVVQAARLVF